MKELDEAILQHDGWEVECESPIEIRHTVDGNSFASGIAVSYILDYLNSMEKLFHLTQIMEIHDESNMSDDDFIIHIKNVLKDGKDEEEI